MPFAGVWSRLSIALFFLSLSSSAQNLVYSGREYLKVGRSWAQIRELDVATNKRVQVTTSPHNHWHPWCAPDGKSILFTSSPENGKETLYRFDRLTKHESLSVALDQTLFRVADAIDSSRVVVEEYGGIIEIVDIARNTKIRKISGEHPVLSPNHTLMAWQTPVDKVMHREQRSHILISALDGTSQLDLGEGNTPVFLPDTKTLMFIRPRDQRLDLVRYSIESQRQEVNTTRADLNDPFDDPYDLTISPDGTTIVFSACCGRYGSAVYWRLMSDQTWKTVDDNLGGWGGGAPDGFLVYATDGRDLRHLDPNRGVWVGDIRLFDSRTGLTRTIVQGISQNQEPRWCRNGSR